MKQALIALLAVLVALLAAFFAHADAVGDQHQLLQLKAAWVQLEQARGERDRAQKLFDEGLLSGAGYETAQAQYRTRQVAYQQEFLRLFAATPRVSVVRCVKSYQGEGRQAVAISLRNSSAPALDYRAVGITDDGVPLPDMQKLRGVDNVFVSLTDENGVIISEPYEQVVKTIGADGAVTVHAALLRDVDIARVVLSYAGRTETAPVFLEKDTSANVVRLVSQQFSQEADLGGGATYDLRLERYSGGGNIVALRVLGLPEEIGAEFIDPATQARMTQIKFDEGTNARSLQLRIFLPEVTGEHVALDRPLVFWVAALGRDVADALPPGRALPAEQFERLRAGAARLELVPRGVGRLEVSAPQLFHEIRAGDPAQFPVVLRNIGTRRIDNARLRADAPAGWEVSIEPATVPRLEPNGEVRLAVSLRPGEGTVVGDYSVRLRTEAYTDNRRLESQDQSARIQVTASPNIVGMLALAAFAIGSIGALVWWGVKVTRR